LVASVVAGGAAEFEFFDDGVAGVCRFSGGGSGHESLLLEAVADAEARVGEPLLVRAWKAGFGAA